jgi:tetratricopeptide (TPR) repeat protein
MVALTGGRRLALSTIALVIVASIIVALQVRGTHGLTGWRNTVGSSTGAPDTRSPVERQLETVQAQLRQNPNDVKALGQLGQIYLQRARETGDPAYYPRAETAFKSALDHDGNNLAAIVGLGSLALSRHQFRDALTWGERARTLAPQTAAVYGVMGDAQTELGLYPEAVATFQKMIDLRPDLASYSRVSYARELHGQMDGAIDAMRQAADAGAPGDEGTAWTRVQLGTLYFTTGQLDAAETEYRHALFEVPNYLHAEAGLGRVAAARGDYAAAITWYKQATATVPVTQYVIELGDIYAAAGQPQAAADQYALVQVQARLLAANGVNDDLEFALFAADHPAAGLSPAEVVAQARAALAARPTIYGHDVLAWALYRAGQYDEAAREITAAFALGTQDPLLSFHAAAIAEARGDTATARQDYQAALRINPHFSVLHAPEAQAALIRLGGH